MKTLLTAVILMTALVPAANADTYVNGYTTKNGTYVAPHIRSSPNGNPYDNYSTQGNVNPYTGQKGYVNPYKR